MLFRLNLSKKGLLLVAVPLFFELVFVLALSFLLYASDKETEKQARAKEIANVTNGITKHIFDVVSILFVYTVNRDDVILERFNKMIANTKKELKELKILAAPRKSLAKKFKRVEEVADRALALVIEAKESLDEGGLKLSQMRGSENRQRVQKSIHDCVTELTDFLDEAQRLEKYDPKRIPEIRRQISIILGLGIVVSIAMAVYIALFFSRDISNRVLAIRDNANRLGEGKELSPPIGGQDEIKELDNVFRSMASNLDSARAALRNSEMQMRNILDTAPQGLLLVDKTGAVKYGNNSAQTMLLMKPDSFDELGTIFGEERGKFVLQSSIGDINQKESEFELSRSDSSHFPASVLARPFPQGEADLTLVAFNDISEHKRIEEMKQQFVAMLTHDLRSPLTALQIFLESLGLELKTIQHDANSQKRLLQSQNNLRRLIGLINDLLDLDKIKDGHLILHNKKRFFLNDAITDSVQTISALAESKQVRIEMEETDAEIEGEEEKITRLVTNLLSNAIKFSPAGKSIQIKLEEMDNTVKVHVIDEGPGISRSDLSLVFESFYQTNEGSKIKDSSGLGLAICKAIVLAHGGSIGVESELGQGADFWFTLQLV